MRMGKKKMPTWRSGNKIAQAAKMPKIAPDAPMVGMSEGACPKIVGIVFTRTSISPAPTPVRK